MNDLFNPMSEFDGYEKICANCKNFSHYQAIGSSHLRFYGMCSLVEATRHEAYSMPILLSASPVMLNQWHACDQHQFKEVSPKGKKI
jgi:hypothetical protein